jgi:hypothetical protein
LCPHLWFDDRIEALFPSIQEVAAMDKEVVFSVEETPDGGYVAKADEYSLVTEAETLSELERQIHDAILCNFDEKDRPTLISLEIEQERLAG